MADHDWHLFDEQRGYEVMTRGGVIYVRDRGGRVVTLTRNEFAQLRSALMAKPKGLR